MKFAENYGHPLHGNMGWAAWAVRLKIFAENYDNNNVFSRSRRRLRVLFVLPSGFSRDRGVLKGAADLIVESIWPRPRFSSRLLPKGLPKGLVTNGPVSTISSPNGTPK